MRHTFSSRVRFGHSDPAGIVYYPRFFEWFHDHFESLFEIVLGEPYAQVLNRRRVGFPAVQIQCDFRKPARFGDLVDVHVFLSRLTERSATFEYRVMKEGELLATASVKVAAMDMDRHTGTQIPEDIRSAFLPYVEVV
jgi:4-hydroxybenzoyl-CoA thioesterase